MKLQVDLYKWPDDSWRFARPDEFIEMRRTTLPGGFVPDAEKERVMGGSTPYLISMNYNGDIVIKEEFGQGARALQVFHIERG